MVGLGTGDRVDRYLIEAAIAEGGMGKVFRAYDERLDRRVALKIVSAPPGDEGEREAHSRLQREARAVSKLDHPNVVAVFDVGETAEGPFIVMELVPGSPLRELIDAGSLSTGDRVRVLRDVALGLAAAHDAGIVHRDVKPENVIVRPDGRVKVLDFGIARAAPRPVDGTATTGPNLATLTQDGAKLGTPRYMAPEQIKGGVIDGRTDQFAWGVTAFELLTGHPPFRGPDAMAIMAAVLTEPAPPVTGAPAHVARVVARALAKDPAQRFPTMKELLAALGDAEEEAAAAGPARDSRAPAASSSPHPVASGLPASSSVRPPSRSSSPPVAKPVAAPQLSRRYSVQELEEVFDRALSVQRTGYSYDDLASAAREIGVDARSLDHAMGELEKRGAVEPRSNLHAPHLRWLVRHVGIWLAVSVGLFFLNAFETHFYEWWFHYTMISWGMGVAVHAVFTLTRSPRAPKPIQHRSPDPILAHDASRVAEYLASQTPRGARIASFRPLGAEAGGAQAAEEEALAEEAAAAASRRAARRSRE